MRDYVGEMTHQANFSYNRYSGAFPQIGEILPLCDFSGLSCPVLTFFSILRPGRTAGPIFTLYGSNDVFPWSFWVRTIGGHIFGENPKIGGNRQFQAKTPKNKNRHNSETINRIKTKFDDQGETNNYTPWVV